MASIFSERLRGSTILVDDTALVISISEATLARYDSENAASGLIRNSYTSREDPDGKTKRQQTDTGEDFHGIPGILFEKNAT
ncbi:hypothetical protein K0M31_018265 [Melipona bicolor]|uniref:Uncharacterized protein n=1 Tax=Melipona bicolor TaxID=60889 RepID=A0AA40KDP7_9HYME|nr:hypothetical protein K0M31_018265 [Melipona bicolor]